MTQTPLDLAYAAGFIDGEGCFTISKNGAVCLSVINTYRPALEFLSNTMGGKVRSRKQRANKAQYVYQIYGEDCVRATCAVLPYLKEKKPQADVLLEFRSIDRSVRLPGRRGQFSANIRNEYRQRIADLKRI